VILALLIIASLGGNSLNCPMPEIIDETNLEWTENDSRTLEHAKKQCPIKYPNSPCLGRFIKRDFQVYWVICTQELKD
jgi:hypothetical protein